MIKKKKEKKKRVHHSCNKFLPSLWNVLLYLASHAGKTRRTRRRTTTFQTMMMIVGKCSQRKSLKAFCVVLWRATVREIDSVVFIFLWGHKTMSLNTSDEKPPTNLASCSCPSTHLFLLTSQETCIRNNCPHVCHASLRQTVCRSSRLTWPCGKAQKQKCCRAGTNATLQHARFHSLTERETWRITQILLLSFML